MKKTCGAIIVLLCILLNTVIPISASEFSLHWTNVVRITHDITFSDGVGTYSVLIEGNREVTLIIAKAKLYYKNVAGSWVDTELAWDYNKTSNSLSFSENFQATMGIEYKVVLTLIAYQDVGEAITETIVKQYKY